MKGNKKKTIGTIVKCAVAIIAAALIVLDIVAGNYLVSFAL